VFDCDGTLIDGDISSLTGWFLMKNGMVDTQLLPESFRSPKFYMDMNLIDYDKVRREVSAQLGPFQTLEWELLIQSGLPHDLVVDYAHKAIQFGFEKSIISFTPGLSNFLKEFSAQSWIVSGSSFPTVVALAKRLGLHSDRVLATKLELVDGIYMKSFSPPGFVWEKTKVVALENAGVVNPYFVAGDSVGDWYMMQKSTHWVWCMLWDENRFGGKGFRKFLEANIPFGQQIPKESGFYVTEWQRKRWVFEVI